MERSRRISSLPGKITGRYLLVALLTLPCLFATPHEGLTQSTTAPPSSLPTVPLSPDATIPESRSSCDLCWKPEPQAGSTLHPHRLHREKGLHPHKKPKGTHRSNSPSSRSLLRRQAPAPLGGIERTLDGRQVHVVDGATFRYGPDRVRLRGIATPELNEPGGQAARSRLEEWLRRGPVRIVPYGRDVYDRLVADVFVDAHNVGELLTQEGYAKPSS
jgi:endonuclease YncB( thermonuclease family)